MIASKKCSAADAAAMIDNGAILGVSGFTLAGYPKAVPAALATRAEKLHSQGMVCDFTEIKRLIHGKIDHTNINEVLDFNPTAENLAKWIVDTVPNCYRADVWESRDNKASYIKDDAPQIFD